MFRLSVVRATLVPAAEKSPYRPTVNRQVRAPGPYSAMRNRTCVFSGSGANEGFRQCRITSQRPKSDVDRQIQGRIPSPIRPQPEGKRQASGISNLVLGKARSDQSLFVDLAAVSAVSIVSAVSAVEELGGTDGMGVDGADAGVVDGAGGVAGEPLPAEVDGVDGVVEPAVAFSFKSPFALFSNSPDGRRVKASATTSVLQGLGSR